jgi:deoxyribodipyrimidine photolyase-related protein
MKAVSIVFPHQLFKKNPCVKRGQKVYLVEEYLFFRQYRFHKQKIAFHRASMKFYNRYLTKQNIQVEYIEAHLPNSDIRTLIKELSLAGVKEICITEVTDNWLNLRIRSTAKKCSISVKEFESPLFLNSLEEISSRFSNKKRFFQTEFYIDQRKKRKLLLEPDGKPAGGKWSFDAENRTRFPKNETAPPIMFPAENEFVVEAKKYTLKKFQENPGELITGWNYPTTFLETNDWLDQFFEKRFFYFGKYEDAIIKQENILYHSVLSPVLNVGLISPDEVIDKAVSYAKKQNIPVNSLEGFIRQIVGWREFIRAVYELKGSEERTRNFWHFNRKIPPSFWEGNTGILPVDNVIRKVLKTGYSHHIERLMILGNFMLLCEFAPDDVYRWFMELFIDSYDWVMVPNVYGMSQFADGGLMATKPYISGSNYLMKMGNYPSGDWQKTWDGLFWRFLHTHRNFFLKNPRLAMLVRMFDKMSPTRQNLYLDNANQFLSKMDN